LRFAIGINAEHASSADAPSPGDPIEEGMEPGAVIALQSYQSKARGKKRSGRLSRVGAICGRGFLVTATAQPNFWSLP